VIEMSSGKKVRPYTSFLRPLPDPGSHRAYTDIAREMGAGEPCSLEETLAAAFLEYGRFLKENEVKAEDRDLQAALTRRLTQVGLDFKVDGWAIRGWKCLRKELGSLPLSWWHGERPGWTPGISVAVRHRKTLREFIDSAPARDLPIYMWPQDGAQPVRINEKVGQYPHSYDLGLRKVKPYSYILKFQEDPLPEFTRAHQSKSDLDKFLHKIPEAFWWLVPLFWWFKDEELEFYEKLHKIKIFDVDGNELPGAPNWFSPFEFIVKRGKTLSWLQSKIQEREIEVYSLNQDGIEACGHQAFTFPPNYADGDYLLKREEIEKYVKTHPNQFKASRVEQNPNFKRAIEFAKNARKRYSDITKNHWAQVTWWILTYEDVPFNDEHLANQLGDGTFDYELLERRYAGARQIKRERFTGKKPKYSTVRQSWFVLAFPEKPHRPSKGARQKFSIL
jgi:hypothetical protein